MTIDDDLRLILHAVAEGRQKAFDACLQAIEAQTEEYLRLQIASADPHERVALMHKRVGLGRATEIIEKLKRAG
jgi:hypothetical protein